MLMAVDIYRAADFVEGVTRHTELPTSSAISNAPCLSIGTPSGRPGSSSLSEESGQYVLRRA